MLGQLAKMEDRLLGAFGIGSHDLDLAFVLFLSQPVVKRAEFREILSNLAAFDDGPIDLLNRVFPELL